MKSYVGGLLVLFLVLSGVMIGITMAGRFATVATATYWAASYQPSVQGTSTPSRPVETPADQPDAATPSDLPTGGSAIKPTIDNPGPGMPAFTAADVEGYITFVGADLYLGRRIQIDPASPPQIAKLEFLTDRDLRSRLGGKSTGLSDDALLCYVELSGNFRLISPFEEQVSSQTLRKGILVFNAQTGNIMMAGAMP